MVGTTAHKKRTSDMQREATRSYTNHSEGHDDIAVPYRNFETKKSMERTRTVRYHEIAE